MEESMEETISMEETRSVVERERSQGESMEDDGFGGEKELVRENRGK
jgi:hypothetical protein